MLQSKRVYLSPSCLQTGIRGPVPRDCLALDFGFDVLSGIPRLDLQGNGGVFSNSEFKRPPYPLAEDPSAKLKGKVLAVSRQHF